MLPHLRCLGCSMIVCKNHYNVFIQNNIIFCILADFDQYKYIIGLYVHCILDSVQVRVYFHFLFQVTYQADWEKGGGVAIFLKY